MGGFPPAPPPIAVPRPTSSAPAGGLTPAAVRPRAEEGALEDLAPQLEDDGIRALGVEMRSDGGLPRIRLDTPHGDLGHVARSALGIPSLADEFRVDSEHPSEGPPMQVETPRSDGAAEPTDGTLHREIRAFGGLRRPRAQVAVLVLGFALILGAAFLMALLSHRR